MSFPPPAAAVSPRWHCEGKKTGQLKVRWLHAPSASSPWTLTKDPSPPGSVPRPRTGSQLSASWFVSRFVALLLASSPAQPSYLGPPLLLSSLLLPL